MHEKLYRFDLPDPTSVEFAVADYPHWQVEINGQPVAHQLSPTGNILVTVPGDQEVLVGLRLRPTPIRALANLLSLFTFTIVLGFTFYPPLCQRKK
jgi:hypothetical protein